MLLLHFLDTSIDPVDPAPPFVPENLAINEIESIRELVAEVFLGLDDFYEERDEGDEDKTASVENPYFFPSPGLAQELSPIALLLKKQDFSNRQGNVLQPWLPTSTPPPKNS